MHKYRENYFNVLNQIEPPMDMLNKFWSDSEQVFKLLRDYEVESDCAVELRKIANQNPIAMRLLEV